jgi:glycosyltransferase involved in cell wall biosynthesis
MKILYYSAHPQLKLNTQSGPGTHMRETIAALRELGHEVLPVIIGDLLSPGTVPTGNVDNRSRSLIKSLIPKILWRSLKELKLMKTDRYAEKILVQQLARFKPDLVYERAAYFQVSGINAVKNKNVAHFIEVNAPFIQEIREFEKANTLWLRRAKRVELLQIEEPDLVYVVSTALKKHYAGNTTEPEKIHVVPNCVNPKYIQVDLEMKNKLIDTFGLGDKRIIGFVGSIFPYHGVDILIEAFSKIADEFPDTLLLIVGDGEILNDLKKSAIDLNIEKKVLFTGSRPHHEVFTWIDIMDICVMAKSNWYGSPVKIFEYGAMGKAIIAPNTIPVKDVMENNIDGILIDPFGASLSDALKKLLTDDVFKKQLALRFKEKVLKEYTWKKTADKIVDDFESYKR